MALFTESGQTARQLSKYHPSAPIFALSPIEVTINRLNLLWGTTPVRCPKINSTEALVECAENLLEQNELRAAPRGDCDRGRYPHQIRLNKLYAPARDGRAEP